MIASLHPLAIKWRRLLRQKQTLEARAIELMRHPESTPEQVGEAAALVRHLHRKFIEFVNKGNERLAARKSSFRLELPEENHYE